MPIWKVTTQGPKRIAETKLRGEEMLEEKLEEWIMKDPSLLGEPLFIIGRQVIVPEVKDRIDLLALDPQGNSVIIELKQGRLKDPVDMQGLRYASYVSKWSYEDFESQAKKYIGKTDDPDFNFNGLYEQFCAKEDIREVPSINTDQRIILVGSEVKEKLGSVALWLNEHDVDIKVVEIEFFKEGDSVLLQPHIVVPVPVGRFSRTGARRPGDGIRPWVVDGKIWHLEKKCGPKIRDMLLRLDDLIQDNFDVDGPMWNQRIYVSYKIRGHNWIYVNTYQSALVLDIHASTGNFEEKELAKRLGVQVFDKKESLSEKIGLPSSVTVGDEGEGSAWIKLRIKEDFDLDSTAFLKFLKEAYESFPG